MAQRGWDGASVSVCVCVSVWERLCAHKLLCLLPPRATGALAKALCGSVTHAASRQARSSPRAASTTKQCSSPRAGSRTAPQHPAPTLFCLSGTPGAHGLLAKAFFCKPWDAPPPLLRCPSWGCSAPLVHRPHPARGAGEGSLQSPAKSPKGGEKGAVLLGHPKISICSEHIVASLQ